MAALYSALLVSCALSSIIAQTAAKGVTASLSAKWPESPLLLEASEFIAEEGNDKFWQFLGTVQEMTIYKNKDSEYSYYSLILKKAGQFLSDLQLTLMKFALSLRAYSPTVQMFQQIAADEPPPEGCGAFVSIHGSHTCKASQVKKLLKDALERPRPYLYKGDHVFPSLTKTAPVVLLYAEVGTKAFATFHKTLIEKAESGEITYVLRHYIQTQSSRKINLSGYGVELAIKDTEYKAMDDTQAAVTNSTTSSYEGIDEDVQGFYFDKLIQMYPDLKNNLVEFRKHLIESTNEMLPLKVWELQETVDGLSNDVSNISDDGPSTSFSSNSSFSSEQPPSSQPPSSQPPSSQPQSTPNAPRHNGERRRLQLDLRTVMEDMRAAEERQLERMHNLSERRFQALHQDAQEAMRQEAEIARMQMEQLATFNQAFLGVLGQLVQVIGANRQPRSPPRQ